MKRLFKSPESAICASEMLALFPKHLAVTLDEQQSDRHFYHSFILYSPSEMRKHSPTDREKHDAISDDRPLRLTMVTVTDQDAPDALKVELVNKGGCPERNSGGVNWFSEP